MGIRKIGEIENEYELLFSEKITNMVKHLGNDPERDVEIIKNLDEPFFKTLTKEVMEYWVSYPYHPVTVIPIKFIKDTLEMTKGSQYLTNLFKEIGVLLPPKEKNKPAEQLFKRVLHHYHLPNVQKNIKKMFVLFLRKQFEVCNKVFADLQIGEAEREIEEETLEMAIKIIVGEVGILTVLWYVREFIQDKEFEQWIISSNKRLYVMGLAQAAHFSREVELEKIMVKPETQLFNSTAVELKNVKKDVKRLTKLLQKETNKYSELQKEFFELKRENKRLAWENHEIYQMNEQDKRKHIEEMNSLEEYYLNVIEQITSELDVEEDTNESFEMDLKGLTIAVIGGSKVRHFRELIEKNNGKIVFVSEDDYNKIEGAISKADVVFYLKEVVGHHFFRIAYPLAQKTNVPFIYINTLGVSTFKRELEKLVV